MKFNINEVKVTDLEGNKIFPADVAKAIGNQIYTNATTLDWDIIAREIYAGKEVEINEAQLEAIEKLLLSDQSPLKLMVKKPLKDYLNTLKNNTNGNTENNKQ